MKKTRCLAWILALALLLSGCTVLEQGMNSAFDHVQSELGLSLTTPTGETETAPAGVGETAPGVDPAGDTFADFVYVRPDVDRMDALSEELQTMAAEGDSDELLPKLTEYLDRFDDFCTMMNLADVRYCLDLTDTYYQEEYNYCAGQSAHVDEQLDSLYRALAASPMANALEDCLFGDGFFDYYRVMPEDLPEDFSPEAGDDGQYVIAESPWSQELIELLNRESELEAEYYRKMQETSNINPLLSTYYTRRAEALGPVLLELIAVRQDMAALLGYDGYEEMAWEWYYYRDYTPEEALAYAQGIQEQLAPLYRQLWETDLFDRVYARSYDAGDCLSYVASAAEQMGGAAEDAFDSMTQRGLYDLKPSRNKYEGSFEVYLAGFEAPFILLNPNGNVTDLSSFAHEFGHFTNDYAAEGSYLSTDNAEILSQGMELLAMCYSESPDPETLSLVRQTQLASALCTYVEEAAYHTFEHEIYLLEGDQLTLENLDATYARVAESFGLDTKDWDDSEWVEVPHFYTEPFYIISYAASVDAAMQLYELEQETPGAGLKVYNKMVFQWEDRPFLTFLSRYRLKSPFVPERMESLAACFQKDLLDTLNP